MKLYVFIPSHLGGEALVFRPLATIPRGSEACGMCLDCVMYAKAVSRKANDLYGHAAVFSALGTLEMFICQEGRSCAGESHLDRR